MESVIDMQVCDGPVLRNMLRDDELELLVCGLPHLDFEALQAAARYEGGFSAEHPTVRSFWQVLREMPLDKKKRFLAFATGSDRCACPQKNCGTLRRKILFPWKARSDSSTPKANAVKHSLWQPHTWTEF